MSKDKSWQALSKIAKLTAPISGVYRRPPISRCHELATEALDSYDDMPVIMPIWVDKLMSAARAEGYADGRRKGMEDAADYLVNLWDDGMQGPPRSEIEQYAEILLLRSLAKG